MKSSINRLTGIIICLLFITSSLNSQEKIQQKNIQKRFTVLGLGDSITEGGENFQVYLFPLWEKLFTAGYDFDFIGPKDSKCRIGKLNCAGFGGRNAEFLDAQIDSIYQKYPADIVLLHTGHNHFDTENPVAGIIKSQESIIHKIRAINPEVKIFVAQVIPSGKLPKYSYIPELNRNIVKMVKRINSKNIILVNQSKGFKWQKNTIEDKVHPNSDGAEKMAEVWFKAIIKVLAPSKLVFKPEILSYKQVTTGELNLHVFSPKEIKRGEKRPVIIYFFGGGWAFGTPLQFYRECAYFASKGMVAISADYRIAYSHKTTVFESFEDAKDALRWLRLHAKELNINPNRIAAAGASAGGHLAAATGILKDSITSNTSTSYKPNLLLLYYPVIDNSVDGFGTTSMKKRYKEISPLHNIDATAPSTLFLLGTKDNLIPVKTAEEFTTKMQQAGVNCELHLYEGAGHPIFSYSKVLSPDYTKILNESEEFLKKSGYLK